MATVVFFRAVNVGGHQKFQPSVLAGKLAKFGVVNVGAAGTFVVREPVSQAELKEEILGRLPFQPELMICPAREVLALAASDWFHDAPAGKGVGRFVSVMRKAPRTWPRLPLDRPPGDKWEVRVVGIIGRYALSLKRPGKKDLYPNAVIEKLFSTPATTRNWNTVETIIGILKADPDSDTK